MTTLSSLNLLSVEELKTYLTENGKVVPEGALKPAILAMARETFLATQTTDGPTKVKVEDEEEDVKEAEDKDEEPEDALRLMQAKGFANKAEAIAMLAVFDRELAAIAEGKKELEAGHKLLEMDQIQLAADRKSLEARAEEVREATRLQSELCDRNMAFKKEFDARLPS